MREPLGVAPQGITRRKQLALFRRKMKQFDRQHKAFLFGTHNGGRVQSFKKAAIKLFETVGLKFGRGKGEYRIHDARHETISALSQSREFNDAQVKKFTGIRADRTIARYRHLENMDVAVLAANVLDERSAAQEAESVLGPFMCKGWSIEQRATFVKAARAMAEATEQPLADAAEMVLAQLHDRKGARRKGGV